MRDFYQVLEVEPTASRKELRAALMGVKDVSFRNRGASILLDERRRAIYDRDRQALATIGRMRSHLGLYLAPFWARGDMADFTYTETPAVGSPRFDDIMVKQAFAPAKSRRRRHRHRRSRNPEIKAAIIGGIIALALILLLIFLSSHNLLSLQVPQQ